MRRLHGPPGFGAAVLVFMSIGEIEAQSLFVEEGQHAVMASGTFAGDEGKDLSGWGGTLAGSIEGKTDVFLTSFKIDKEDATTMLGLTIYSARSRRFVASGGLGVTVLSGGRRNPGHPQAYWGVAAQLGVQWVQGNGRWRVVPQASANGGITFADDPPPLIGGTVGVVFQGHFTRRTSLVLNPAFAVSGPLGAQRGPYLHMFGVELGLVVLVN